MYRLKNQQHISYFEYMDFNNHHFNLKGNIKSMELLNEKNEFSNIKYEYNQINEITSLTNSYNYNKKKTEYYNYQSDRIAKTMFVNSEPIRVISHTNIDSIISKSLGSSKSTNVNLRFLNNDTISYTTPDKTYFYKNNKLIEVRSKNGQILQRTKYLDDKTVKIFNSSNHLTVTYDMKGRLVKQELVANGVAYETTIKYCKDIMCNVLTKNIQDNKVVTENSLVLNKINSNYFTGNYSFTDYTNKRKEEKIEIFLKFNEKGDIEEQKINRPNNEWPVTYNPIGEVMHFRYYNYIYDCNNNWIERSMDLVDLRNQKIIETEMQKRIIEYYKKSG